jgi:integrase
MSIKEYQSNGKTFYEIYVHVKSNVDPLLRIQKKKKNIATLNEAAREETRMIKEALIELGSLEEKSDTWERIIELWYNEQVRNGFSNYSNKFTAEDYKRMLQRYTATWMKRRPHELTRGDGKKVLDSLASDLKSKSFILKVKNTINLIFQWGIDNRLIREVYISPVKVIKIDKKEEKFPEILNLTEIRTFLYEAKARNHEWYPVWATALLTGMRSGELFALEWNDVDFENTLVRVKKSFNKRTNEIKSTKAGYWRNVPISNELNNLLVDLKSLTGSTSWVLPRLSEWLRGEQAKPLRHFLKELGLPSIKFHTLRACFATQLLADGVETAKVMKIGGWKDLKTMQIYMRLAGVDEKGATEGLRFLPSDEAVMGRVVELFSKS